MNISLRSAQSQTKGLAKLYNLGKGWEVNTTGRALYPCFKNEDGSWELMAAVCAGHSVNDFQALGNLKAIFIPSNSELDDNLNVITPDAAYQFSKIAYPLVMAQKAAAIQNLRNKRWPDDSQLQAAINEVNAKYDPKNMKAIRPVIGKLSMLVTSECLYVPIDATTKAPLVDQARPFTQNVSGKAAALLNLLSETPPTDDFPYLEVEYAWVSSSNDKSEAGRASPTKVVESERIIAKYPELDNALRSAANGLASSSDEMLKRNSAFARKSEAQIIRALSNYCIMKTDTIQYADLEDLESIERNLNVFAMLSVASIEGKPEWDQKLQEEADALKYTDGAPVAPKPKSEEAPPTIEDIAKDFTADNGNTVGDVTLDDGDINIDGSEITL